jgi:DNA-binding transcriptional LysR family regulator
LPDMRYRASVLIEFRVALYAAPAYLARHEAPQSPEDLAAHELIAVGQVPRGAVHWKLAGARGSTEVVARAVMQVSNFAGMHRLLLAGGGIGAIPEIVAASSLTAGRLVPVLPQWTVARARLFAISVAGREAPARVRVFREYMREELRNHMTNM